ncbi:MAG TPA: hypothetical protein VJ848_00090 [Candidatus Angelobacter sp.]|nr:hypothetical protein [Candidatus Angelobacter sp.]
MHPQVQAETTSASAAAIAPAPAAEQVASWSLTRKLAFRFGFVYFGLYCFPSPLNVIPKADIIFGWWDKLWQKLVIWTGAHILHLSQPVQYPLTGSGDTMHDYIQNMLFLVFAFAATLLWSFLDRKRRNYIYLHEWLRLYVRLFLGATLLGYGAYKVIKSQFSYPYLSRLLEPYGNSSPMGLLWTFMGYSKTYNIFTGLVEMVGGALVILPRLTTLGALISAAAMTNVFILNMSYDVPVKIFSLNLLLMSCFLLLPELGRLTNVFVLNRPAPPLESPRLFQRRSLMVGLLAAQIIFLMWSAGYSLRQSYQQAKDYGDLATRPPLYGIYSVEEFSVDGQPRPPLFTDETRWHRVTFDLFNSITIAPAEGKAQRFRGKLDEKGGTLELTKPDDQKWKANFTLDHHTPGIILLSGETDGKKILAKLKKIELNSFLLNNRGFHWISEFPFNR